MGQGIGVKDLPVTSEAWKTAPMEHMQTNLQRSKYTDDLSRQYHKHLGLMRNKIMCEAQILVIPKKVRQLLTFRHFSLLYPLPGLNRMSRILKVDLLVKKHRAAN